MKGQIEEDRFKRFMEWILLSGMLRAIYVFKSCDFEKDGKERRPGLFPDVPCHGMMIAQ